MPLARGWGQQKNPPVKEGLSSFYYNTYNTLQTFRQECSLLRFVYVIVIIRIAKIGQYLIHAK
jgi:hypothetical protein